MRHAITPLRQRRLALCAAAGLCATLLAGSPAVRAQPEAFPHKPITLVVPFPPGGSTDVLGRLFGKLLSEQLKQPVIIDNRPGAGTILGAQLVAKAPADGYTLLLSSGSTFTVNPAIRPNLPYDPVKSFDPIAIVARVPLVLLANNAVPVKDVKGFVQAVKAQPEKFAYASFGSGTTSHFTGEIILQAIGGKMLHVPYKGSAPAMTDLIGGQVPYSVDTVIAALPQLKAGKIKAIAVTTARRSQQLPDVPSFAESGYPQVDADTWLMLAAPKGTPPAVRATLEKTLGGLLAQPAVRQLLLEQGAEPAFSTAAQAAAQIDKELPLMRAVAQRANIRPD